MQLRTPHLECSNWNNTMVIQFFNVFIAFRTLYEIIIDEKSTMIKITQNLEGSQNHPIFRNFLKLIFHTKKF